MKIWFRTGRERGGAARGERQGSEQSRPAGLLRPFVISAAAFCVDPAAGRKPLFLRHESAPIPSAAATLYSAPAAAIRPKAPVSGPQTLSRDGQFSDSSTRFWAKSRSDRKHTTKPCLPGSRFAHCDARTSAVKPLSNRELRLLETSLTPCKQTIAPRSNRELSTNRDRLGIDTLCGVAQDVAHSK
jgi:hypothetical protein